MLAQSYKAIFSLFQIHSFPLFDTMNTRWLACHAFPSLHWWLKQDSFSAGKFFICFVSQIRVILWLSHGQHDALFDKSYREKFYWSGSIFTAAFLLAEAIAACSMIVRKLVFIGEIIFILENSVSWKCNFAIRRSMFTGKAQWNNWRVVWVLAGQIEWAAIHTISMLYWLYVRWFSITARSMKITRFSFIV